MIDKISELRQKIADLTIKIDQLRDSRNTIAKEIGRLYSLRRAYKEKLKYQEQIAPLHKNYKNSVLYKMFGKRLKELTKEERRQYNRVMQQDHRIKKKEKNNDNK